MLAFVFRWGYQHFCKYISSCREIPAIKRPVGLTSDGLFTN